MQWDSHRGPIGCRESALSIRPQRPPAQTHLFIKRSKIIFKITCSFQTKEYENVALPFNLFEKKQNLQSEVKKN